MDCDLTGVGWDDHYATVEIYASMAGMSLDEAYNTVENGPVII